MKSEPLFPLPPDLCSESAWSRKSPWAENRAALHATLTVDVPISSHGAGKADIRGDCVG